MFAHIAAFELRYQIRQPAFWVISILFVLISFSVAAFSDVLSINSGGNVHVNSPYAITGLQMILNLIFMLASAAVVANVVTRDYATGFGPIMMSTPISRAGYLFGRFTGAFLALTLAAIIAQLGHIAGTLMPGIDPETLGPIRPQDYLYAVLVLGLPGLFVISAIFFTLATVFRSMMATYVGVIAVFILYTVATSILGSKPEFEALNVWVDPFGAAAYQQVTRYWTPLERNTLNVPLEGVFLWTRLFWTAVGVAVLGLALALFRRSARGAKATKLDRQRAEAEAKADQPFVVGALPAPTQGFAAVRARLVALTAFEMGQVFKSFAYGILLVLAVAFAIMVLMLTDQIYGAPVVLVTRVVITALMGSFSLILMIIAIYYSGEMVWRDRERKVHEIIDATSTPDWVLLLPKVVALSLVLISTIAASVVAGIIVQSINGYFEFEIGKYLYWYVLPGAIDMTLLAILAIFVQALSPNKFVGWAIMVVYMISRIALGVMGFNHVLYSYSGGVGMPLSDMNGLGDFARFAMWTNSYWGAFAVILLVVVYGLWRRGTETRLKPRLARFPSRMKGPAGLIGGAALAAFAGLGGFIYLNTNVWNEYQTADARRDEQAAYERALLRYENTPQPSAAHLQLVMDLHPHTPSLTTRGTLTIENRTTAPLNEIHLRWTDDLDVRSLQVQGATLAREWPEFDYRIYRFATPMQPGERRAVTFESVMTQRGFKDGGNTTRLVDNGTFVNNMEFAPMIGMSRAGLLDDRTQRRKRGLPAELRPRDLDDPTGVGRNYIGADWVTADITVTTEADQTPVAPGTKVSDQTRDGRRTVRFVTRTPVLNFFSVQSARYVESRRMHDGVEMVVFHDARHDRNVPRMLDGLGASLDYFQTNFSRYQFDQARITEFPDYASFAQSYPNTFAWSEGLGFITDLSKPDKIDFVTYVAAHEFAHQWWAHQVVGADVQGAAALSETLAQYSALMVMEKMYGPDKIRQFLKRELDSYLRARGTERLEEMPLMRVEGQPYIYYQKGGLVMYLLRDQLGEEAVNRALRRVLQQYAFRGAPYPRSTDLVAALKAEAPAGKQGLIDDLFARVALYDLRTTGATATRRADGRWDVSITVEARKLYVTGRGDEAEAPLNETMDVGLFAAEPGVGAFDRNDVILMERRPIRSGTQTLRFVTTQAPKFAGVDPYNKWIDRDSSDNLKPVG
ncbi:MAG: M1 family aminopeptidase [Brevundimonas sp.]|nr:M1 family aminopeptidase [Brevundimonas sp.]